MVRDLRVSDLVVFATVALLGLSTSIIRAEERPSTTGRVLPTLSLLLDPTTGEETTAASLPIVVADDAAEMARFLDRLMMVESGGRDLAKNPRSSALGPFQFIDTTFLEVARRHFASETAGLTLPQILALRTDRPFARRAAEAFTRDNAQILAAHGIPATFGNLRLAFFLGAGGAVRVLSADPAVPVISIVGAGVVQANPFMAGMTARDMAIWGERNLAAASPGRIESKPAGPPIPGTVSTPELVAAQAPAKPVVAPRCNLALASCRKWLAMAEKQVRQATRPASVRVARRPTTATR